MLLLLLYYIVDTVTTTTRQQGMAYSIKIAAGKFHHYQWIPFPVHWCGAFHPFAGKWMGQTTRPTNTHHPPIHPSAATNRPLCHTHLQPQVYFILSTQQQTTRLSPPPLYNDHHHHVDNNNDMLASDEHNRPRLRGSGCFSFDHRHPPTTTIELQRCRCRVCASDRLLMVHAGIWVHLLD